MPKKTIRLLGVLTLFLLLVAACAPAQQVTTPAAIVTQVSTLPPLPTQASPPLETTPPESPEAGVLRFEISPAGSEARYLVREELAGVSLPSDAIGRTQAIAGTLVIQPDGSIDSAQSRFEVDLSTLQSDESRRDNFLRRNTLQTDQYPLAVFVPTAYVGLPAALPTSGQVSFQLIGDLTIKDVTRPVEWQVTAQVEGSRVTGQALTSFTFADFELSQPRVPVVLSVEETIRLEVDFTLVSTGQAAQLPVVTSESPELVDLPATGCTPPAVATPPMAEGPYFTPGSPERTSLLEAGVVGERLLITGFVLTVDCAPIPGALLDFWQTDGQGVYDNAGYRLRGHQFTDANGAYQLETVIPGEYPGRTPHIHVKVQAPGGPVLTTQLFVPGAPSNDTDRIFSPELVMIMQQTVEGAVGVFNFILEN